MTAETEVLNDPMVGGQEGAKHKPYLKGRVDGYAPHFEAGKDAEKTRLEHDHRLLLRLFYVDKIKDVTERVNGA